jgi:hypothetical protein
MIGPPALPLPSQLPRMAAGAVMPAFRSSSSMLSDCSLELVPL